MSNFNGVRTIMINLNRVRIIIYCIAVIVFIAGVSMSSALLRQIAFLILVVWCIASLILQKYCKKKKS